MIFKKITSRIYPNKKQEEAFNFYCNSTRFLYNYLLSCVKEGKLKPNLNCLARRVVWMKKRHKVKVSYKENDVIKYKEVDCTFLRDIPARILVNVCKDLEQAFINFYKKYNKDQGYPKFKSKGISRESFRINDYAHGFRFHNLKLNISMLLGDLKIRGNLDTLLKDTSKLREVTIYKDVDKWYASFTIQHKRRKLLLKTGKEIGLDVGVNRLYTRSDGKYTKNLSSLVAHQQSTITELQRAQQRKRDEFKKIHPRTSYNYKTQSNNYKKDQLKIRLINRKIRRVKLDFLHKKSKMLVSKFDVIKVEDLQIKKMMVKKGKAKCRLNKGFADNSVSTFLNMLEYKADFYGKKLIKVDPQYTSITCSECGVIDKHSRLDQKHFVCTGCGFTINADHNAAINILKSRRVVN